MGQKGVQGDAVEPAFCYRGAEEQRRVGTRTESEPSNTHMGKEPLAFSLALSPPGQQRTEVCSLGRNNRR